MCYYKYHKSRTHDTNNCSVMKREIGEKQLKRNIVEIARSLWAKFDAENPKYNARGGNCCQEILMIHYKRGRMERTCYINNIIGAMRRVNFSTTNPRSLG